MLVLCETFTAHTQLRYFDFGIALVIGGILLMADGLGMDRED